MPELRKDPITDRWVIISSERGKRPNDFTTVITSKNNASSPFSYGNEHMTPPEIYAIRENSQQPDTPGWKLRVVPNKYPALKIETAPGERKEGIFHSRNNFGAHEVIIETPEMLDRLEYLPVNAIAEVFKVFKQRIVTLKGDRRLKYVLIFKNQGVAAGASLQHSHSQLIALPMVPKEVNEEMCGAQRYFGKQNRCIFCDIIAQELKNDIRVIYEAAAVVAIEPFAARVPFETWILPKTHASHFETTDDTHLKHLAVAFKIVMQKLNTALQSPAYNFVLHTAPLQETPMQDYHWHFEILPRLENVAGFEWGTGFYINSTSPEAAAQLLNEIVV